MIFPDQTITALLGLAVGDAFGCPFEFHEEAPALARRSQDEGRYLRGYEDCHLPILRCRTPGLGSDDTQQALLLLWITRELSVRGKDPFHAAWGRELFLRISERMAQEHVSGSNTAFGVHRGTGKNFRSAISNWSKGEYPPDTPGLGAAMRVGPAAALFPSSEPDRTLSTWIVEVSSGTTGNKLAQAAAVMLALAVQGRGPDPAIPFGVTGTSWGLLQAAREALDVGGVENLVAFASMHTTEKFTGPASGFALTGVPFALHCAEKATSFEDALLRACAHGGDTDTMCAMVGCLAALRFGRPSIPAWMLDGLIGKEHLLDPSLWHPIDTERKYVEMDCAIQAAVRPPPPPPPPPHKPRKVSRKR